MVDHEQESLCVKGMSSSTQMAHLPLNTEILVSI